MTFDPWATATPSQKKVLAHVRQRQEAGERSFIYWMGGVRSGKSFGACLALLEHLKNREGEAYMVLAFTAHQATTIFGRELERIARAMGLAPKLTRGALPRLTFKDNTCEVLFKGADKEGRDKAIQGLTLAGLVVDEVPNLHRPTVHQAEARVSGRAGIRIYTSNKTSPYHWTTKYYHDRLKSGEIDGLMVDSVVADNANVDAAFVEERANEFTGSTLTRFINNEFTLDAPPIYQPCMEMGAVKKATAWTAVYGHATGFEVLTASWDAAALKVTAAASVKQDTLEAALSGGSAVLVNANQPLLARRLRAMDRTVRAFREEFDPVIMEIIKQACARHLLWICDGAQGLWEAVNCYSKPGVYEWPIIRAFEALAHPLRTHVS